MWVRHQLQQVATHLKLPMLLVISSGSVPASSAALAAALAIAGGTSMWLAYLQQQQTGLAASERNASPPPGPIHPHPHTAASQVLGGQVPRSVSEAEQHRLVCMSLLHVAPLNVMHACSCPIVSVPISGVLCENMK